MHVDQANVPVKMAAPRQDNVVPTQKLCNNIRCHIMPIKAPIHVLCTYVLDYYYVCTTSMFRQGNLAAFIECVSTSLHTNIRILHVETTSTTRYMRSLRFP